MRRLNLALLATFQLCRARTPGFNVHSDLLAYPQVIPGPTAKLSELRR